MKIEILRLKIRFKKLKKIIRIFVFSLFFIGILFFAILMIIREKKKVVAVVNGQKITIEDIITKIENSPEIYKEYALIDPKVVVEDYVSQVLLFQYAKKYEKRIKKKIEKKVQNYYMEILTQQFVDDVLVKRINISDKEIEDYYNSHLSEFVIPEKVQLFEIVTDTKEKADGILKRLELGESFEKIAETESIAPTRVKRGEIGWIEIDKLEPEIASLVREMRPGEILGNIIKSEMGYHIIKLTGKTDRRILTLQEATPMIKNMLLSQKKKQEVENLMKKLKEKSKVEIYPNVIEQIKERFK